MSDNFVTFVPVDPRFVPTDLRIFDAIDAACRLIPAADAIEETRSEGIRFFDARANFKAVFCPSCNEQLPMQWWSDAMDCDYTTEGFQLKNVTLPCCGAVCTLNDLRYEWPQAFGRFALSIRNPGVASLDPSIIKKLEVALETRLRIVRSHI